MLHLLIWLVYGLIIGLIAKSLYRGKTPVGLLSTIGIGIVGSYIGGLITWLIGAGPFGPSGFLMGVVGGVVFCWGYHQYKSMPK